jgi:hypothetical protein
MISLATMFNPQRILMFMLLALTTSGVAASLMDELSDKSVAQVLDMLESPDSQMRLAAASSIAYRYLEPHRTVINPPTWRAQHPEFPLPPQVVPRLFDHLKSDTDKLVRLTAMRALRDLRSWTNTTSLVATGLEDPDPYVRIWTCEALINISRDYSEPLDAKIIPTLREYLAANVSEDPAWEAAWVSGHLGGAGKPLLPRLRSLLADHKSSKVRHYAYEAIKNIQRWKKGTQ